MKNKKDKIENMIKAKKDLILREIAGESLLIPVGEAALSLHGMIELTETGAFLWKILEQEKTLEELTDCLCKEYEISRETARKDVEEFADKMMQLGIVDRTGEDDHEK